MRHRSKGRKFGRNPNHQRALLKSLVSALFLTERPEDDYLDSEKKLKLVPKVQGRIVTTLEKAKEVRPLVEKCVTLARKALKHQQEADKLATTPKKGTAVWEKWNKTIAPAIAYRRRVLQLIGNKKAVSILFSVIAPRFENRNGGYTRILKLATPRLGDAGKRAILEFVGVRDRVKAEKVSLPANIEK
ncbi:MAG: 50S ribosomal protein L17 [Planctomycetaceae bacterium]|jgi:large subunit ribosomal protein L17|nr:50S ribosomal protein L17 [Planctomycetaceae bacterium]